MGMGGSAIAAILQALGGAATGANAAVADKRVLQKQANDRADKQAQEAATNALAQSQLQRLLDSQAETRREFDVGQTNLSGSQQRAQQAQQALATFAQNPTPENEAAAYAAGNKPDEVARLKPAPKAAPLTPWAAAGFSDEPSYLEFLKQETGAKKPATDHFTFPTGVDAEGKPIILRGNTATGALEPTEQGAKGGAGSGTPQAQLQQGRMLAAVSEARLADERMRKFEDGLLNGSTKIGPVQQAGGALMTNLAGSHGVMGALTQAGSELGLNVAQPEYAQYLRDATTIGRAEQMISPRGGNETMVRANALLARAGSGATKETIDASRMARQALFGAAGGLAQSMTPEQTTKLNAGIESIKAGSGAKGTITKAEHDALVNRGWSEDAIAAKYTVKP